MPETRGITDDHAREVVADAHIELEAFVACARLHEIGDGLGGGRGRKWGALQLDAPGLDFGKVEDVVEQEQQRFRGIGGRPQVAALLRRKLGVADDSQHAEDAVHRRADFVADRGDEFALGLAGGLGLLARLLQFGLAGLTAGVFRRELGGQNFPFESHGERAGQRAVIGRGRVGHVGDKHAHAQPECDPGEIAIREVAQPKWHHDCQQVGQATLSHREERARGRGGDGREHEDVGGAERPAFVQFWEGPGSGAPGEGRERGADDEAQAPWRAFGGTRRGETECPAQPEAAT